MQHLRLTVLKLYPGEDKHYFIRDSYANESMPELLSERSEIIIILKSSLKLDLNYFPKMKGIYGARKLAGWVSMLSLQE